VDAGTWNRMGVDAGEGRVYKINVLSST
jgi:hypothetical protein